MVVFETRTYEFKNTVGIKIFDINCIIFKFKFEKLSRLTRS
jgi:hypothetical protein